MTMPMREFFYGGNEKPHWQEIDDYQRPYHYTADFDYRTPGRTLPTYEFRVPMCCSKCEEKVREELSELEGVFEVFANQLSERVAVTGFVDPFQALKKMKRIKKKSEFWDRSSPILNYSKHSQHKKSFLRDSSHKKHHPRNDTVYRSSSSQISYNREPSRASSSHRKNYASYDDGMSYSDLRPSSSGHGLSHRQNFGSYDDGVSYSDHGLSYRNKYCSYDDGVSYGNRYGSYDDGVSYSDLCPSSSRFSCLPRSRSILYDTVPPFAQDCYTEDCEEDYPLYNRY